MSTQNTTTPAPDYGEPWSRSSFRNCIYTRDGKLEEILDGLRDRSLTCVNACAGMADPAVEIEGLKLSVKGQHSEIQALERQRDLARTRGLEMADVLEKTERERNDCRKKLQAELDVKELGFHMLRACLNLSGTHTWEELAGEVAACRKECDEMARQLEAMREAVKEANALLLVVDNGAQPDINGVNWYDARSLVLAKLQLLITP